MSMRSSRGYSLRVYRSASALRYDNPIKKLAFLCMQNEVSTVYLAREIGVSRATIYNWFSGRSEPTPRLHAKLQDLTNRLSAEYARAKRQHSSEVLEEYAADK